MPERLRRKKKLGEQNFEGKLEKKENKKEQSCQDSEKRYSNGLSLKKKYILYRSRL